MSYTPTPKEIKKMIEKQNQLCDKIPKEYQDILTEICELEHELTLVETN